MSCTHEQATAGTRAMIQMRDELRETLGDGYEAAIQPAMTTLQRIAIDHGVSLLRSFEAAATPLLRSGNRTAVMALAAAVIELYETGDAIRPAGRPPLKAGAACL